MAVANQFVCGIDTGSLRSLSYVAWLRDGEFLLDLYVPSSARPLPEPPASWGEPSHIGLDVPQGLPLNGEKRRVADREAKTPTRRLPRDRRELSEWKAFEALIEAGLEIFWALANEGETSIVGLREETEGRTTVFETYPRYVIKRLWPDFQIPSKRKRPLDYVEGVWSRMIARGYSCTGAIRPSVDQVDAMLCALAAEALRSVDRLPAGTVGIAPILDSDARVLREGFIVSP